MEGGTHASYPEVEVKLPGKVDVKVDEGERKMVFDGDPCLQKRQENKEEEDDEGSVSDGEFIKVEKELIDVKESSHLLKPIAELEENPRGVHLNLLPMEEKIRALELQLETAAKELQHSESEKSLLISEVDLANEKLEKMDKHCKELELDQKRMKEQILEDERKYNLQLESWQEALRSLDLKHRELIDVKEAFNGLPAELESSRKRMEELEAELVLSASEVCKFEELSNERSSHAELESKRALEFEKMLNLAKLDAKEMEDQMGNLKEELKGLYKKIAENQQVEEALRSTALELSLVQENLGLSKSQLTDLEQKLVSRDAVIHELTEELDFHKASEQQMSEHVLELEGLLSATKEKLQEKLVDLEQVEFKLQGQMKEREMIESSLENQKMQILALQEGLVKLTGERETLTGERETLQSAVADLNTKLSVKEETCGQLEANLNLAEQKFTRTDSLLAQAMAYKEELEQKLKSLEGLHHESRIAAETASRRSLELEDLVQASTTAEEGLKAQLRETEMRLSSTEKRNMELEQQLNLAEVKYINAESEIKELCEKTTELSTLLKKAEEESELSKCHFRSYEDTISQLESSLCNSSSRNSKLEQELKDLAEKCAGHEGRATATHQRSLELEELVNVSHSKAEDAGKKAGELELLLEAANYRTQELEQLLSITEANFRDAEAESKQCSSKISEISAEMEAFQTKSANLEAVLQAANEKERELTDMLDLVTAERKNLEDSANISSQKLLEAENLIVVLKNELKSREEKLKSVEKELEASGVRENEMLEKLVSAEEKLEHQHKEVEQAIARNLELQSLHESLVKDSELKLEEAAVRLTRKESEAKQLNEKVKSLEEQMTFYKDQAAEATEKVASLKSELEKDAIKLVALENTVEELNQKVSEAELKLKQSISENELLAGTNSKLREELDAHQCNVNELHELLNSMHAEKEATAEELASHVKTIANLTDEHSRRLELQFETESRMKETEVQLHEAIEKFTQRDSEARNLSEKLLALEAVLEAANDKERQLTDMLNIVAADRKNLEDSANISGQKLLEAENFIVVLKSELKSSEEKLNSLEKELEASGVRENEMLEKLISAEEKLEVQHKEVEQAIARNLELQSLHKSLVKDSELKLEEAAVRLTQKESEAKQLNEQVKSLEEQMTFYKDQAAEATEKVASLKSELEKEAIKLVALENTVEELNQKVSEAELKLKQSISENELLAGTNSKLREELEAHQCNVNELHELLNSMHAEKEATAEELASHVKTIANLTDEHSRRLELQFETESCMKETEVQLHEAIEKFTHRDSEARNLSEKLLALEAVLEAANDKERQLTDMLNIVAADRKNLEDSANSSGQKLLEAENFIVVLKSELKSSEEKLNSVEKELEASGVRENEMLEKLISAEEKLEVQHKEVEQAIARNLELQSLHESLVKDSELKLEEAAISLTEKESEAKQLNEKVKSLEEQMTFYKDQAVEATERAASLKAELEIDAIKLVALENTVEELNQKVSEAELKLKQSISENELLAGTNSKLREELEAHQCNVNELHELLNSMHAEKEATAEELASHVKTIANLTDEHSRRLELQSATESRMKETEVQLHEAIEKFTHRDSEARNLSEKLLALEAVLQAANDKEREFTDMLNTVSAERKNLEDSASISGQKLLEAENLIVVLKNELKSGEEKLKSVERELEASGVRENEVLEKLVSAEENLEVQHKEVEQAIARNLELQSLHESIVKDSELKLEEAAIRLTEKESEAKQLNEKVKSLEEQMTFYKDQAAEATERAVSLKSELEIDAIKLDALENTVEELNQKVLEAELNLKQSISENELLAGTNSKLMEELEAHQCNVNELHELLNLIRVEKEATAEELASHVKTIANLTDEHSRSLELQSATESHMKETEVQLHEAIEKFTQRDSEARNLSEKLLALEAVLQAANEHERELTDMLNMVTAERKNLEDSANISSQKLLEAENLIVVLKNELKSREEKLKSVEKELEASGVRENEMLEKLVSAEENLEHRHKEVEQAIARNLELQSLHESLVKDSELKLEEAAISLTQKESEAKQLNEKVKSLEEQMTFYKDQAAEATEKVASLKSELEKDAIKLVALENTVEELNQKVSEAELKLKQSISENELLAGMNSKLREELEAHQCNVNELHELLNSMHAEKEATAEELASHVKTIANLTDERSRSLELQSATESHMKETEVQLHEAIEKFTHRDSEARNLSEKLLALEAVLQAANDKERELTDMLNMVATERKNLEDSANISGQKLLEAENLIVVLKSELKSGEEKLKGVEKELEASGVRENEMLEKLVSAEENLEVQHKEVEQSIARNLELQSLHESLVKDSELKLEEAAIRLTEKESEAKQLNEKVKSLEEHMTFYKDQGAEATERAASLKAELEIDAIKLVALENTVEELNQKVSEAELKLKQSISENELLAETNSKLMEELEAHQCNVNELHELLNSIHAEKEATAEELASHVKAIANLTNEHSRSLELQFATESRMKETEVQLHEAIEKFTQRDSEARNLSEKLLALEAVLEAANDKERQLTDMLNIVAADRKNLEDSANISGQKLLEAENFIVALKSELKSSEEKLNSLEKELEASGVRENEMLEKLISAEEKLEVQHKEVEQAIARNLELQSLHESLVKDSELKLEEAAISLTEKESEAKQLNEKVKSLEEQMAFYKDQAVEATERAASLKAELEIDAIKLVALENTVEELNQKVSEAELKLKQSISENELLAGTNSKLREELEAHQCNVNELHELLNSMHAEKEATAEELASHVKTIANLTDEHSRSLELQSATESHMKETKVQLHEAIEKFTQRDSEARNLSEKLLALEAVLQAANEHERELTDMLNIVSAERKNLEDSANISSQKLLEAENLIVVLKSELKSREEKLKGVEKELEASGVRENEMLEKLVSAEENLEVQHKEVEQAIARNLELQSLHESLVKDSELKLEEAAVRLTQKESETKQLNEQVKSLEEQMTFYKDQAAEATEKVASLKSELEKDAIKLVALENTVEELNQKVSEAELKLKQSISENELLAGTNSKLREELEAHQCNVNELHELLNSMHAEKEATAEELASHVKTIANLTDEHSRGLELQSAIESSMKETEVQLHEAIEKFTQRDSEARNLSEKLVAVEAQLKTFEEQARETAVVAENWKVELEKALLELRNMEGLAEEMQRKVDHFRSENEGLESTNLSLSKKLTSCETKMNELQISLNVAIEEKEEISLQLHSSRKTIEDLMQQYDSEIVKLQSQITSVMQENNMLNEMYQNAKKELEVIMVQLEGQANEQKAREVSLIADVENLKAELADKTQSKISQLEQQLLLAETKYMEKIESMRLAAAEKEVELTSKLKEHESTLHERDALYEQLNEIQKELDRAHKAMTEQKELDSLKELEREALMKKLLDEMEAKHQHAILLEKQVEKLKQKLQIAETQYKEKVIEEGNNLGRVKAELDGLKYKLSQTVEMEKKIAELENKLANAKSEVKDGTLEAGSKDKVEVKSRDLELNTSTALKRRHKKRSEEVHQTAATTSAISTMNADREPSGLMAFKFTLGLVLVSIIIGIILGKRF